MLDIGYADVDRITKLIPTQPLNIKLKDARKMEPQLDELAAKDPRVKEVLDVAQRLEGVARNASVHAAGVVISPAPLRELVPLYKTNKDEIVTQYDMVGLEKLDLLKMDFLGLTTLTIIDDALKLIERHRGVTLRVEDLPLDDPKTYQEIFSKALTSGIFQFESRGHARYFAPLSAGSVGRSDRAQRALSSRPHGHDRRLHRAQARAQGSGLRSARDERTSWRRPSASWSTRSR